MSRAVLDGRRTTSWSSAQVGEEELHLAASRLRRVAAVDEGLADLEGEVAADRSGRRLDRVGDAHQPADRLVGARTLRDERDERAAGDEVDELAEERLAVVLGVVLLGGVAVERAQLERADCQTLALDPADDLAGETAGDAVGLDQDQCSLDGRHGRQAY